MAVAVAIALNYSIQTICNDICRIIYTWKIVIQLTSVGWACPCPNNHKGLYMYPYAPQYNWQVLSSEINTFIFAKFIIIIYKFGLVSTQVGLGDRLISPTLISPTKNKFVSFRQLRTNLCHFAYQEQIIKEIKFQKTQSRNMITG